jgi:hypothetical protein
MPYFVERLLNVKEDAGNTFFPSMLSFVLLKILWHCWIMEWLLRKPNWCMGMMSLIGTVSSSLLRISRSNTLDSVGRRLIGLYELVSIGGFPSLAIIIIWAYFYCTGK